MYIGILFALFSTVIVYVISRLNSSWNYSYGVLFFAFLPFVALLEDRLTKAIWEYNLGVSFLIIFSLIVFLHIRISTGEWKEPIA